MMDMNWLITEKPQAALKIAEALGVSKNKVYIVFRIMMLIGKEKE